MRESPYLKSIPYHLPWILGLAVIMTVTGPFGSYEAMSVPVRLFFFTCTNVLIWIQVVVFGALLGQFEPIDRWPIVRRMVVAGVLAALPGAIEIFLLWSWLVRPIPLSGVPSIFLQTSFLTVALSIPIGLLVEQRLRAAADVEKERVATASSADPQHASAPDFFRRVPSALGRDLLALEMEDHYLRIHTALGSDLILLRLRDALAELDPGRGRQVHRSWWVAEGAVASAERDPRRPILVLRNGLRVPVSKTYRDQVKEAGWLDG